MSALIDLDETGIHSAGDTLHGEVNLEVCDHCEDCEHEHAADPGPVRECNGTCDAVAAMVVRTAIPLLTMNLYCWQHKANHTLPLADVERIVYALGAEVGYVYASTFGRDMSTYEDMDGEPDCLLDVLKGATTGLFATTDQFAAHVERGVECRAAAGEWIA